MTDTYRAFNHPLRGRRFYYEACACRACWGERGLGLDWYLYSVEDSEGERAPTEEEHRIAAPYIAQLVTGND